MNCPISRFETLYDGEHSVLGQLQDVTNCVQELGQIDAQCQTWVLLLESSAVALQEVTQHLREFRSQIESDPERMEVIDSRVAGLQRLKKKIWQNHRRISGIREISPRRFSSLSSEG